MDLVFVGFVLLEVCLGCRECWRRGMRYEKVLPVPVGAVTRIFLFSNRAGMACIWIGVGFVSPTIAIPFAKLSLK